MPTSQSPSGMTQASVRSANLASVLGCVLTASTTISRADIAAKLSMTRSTVSRLVDDLVLGQLLEEGTTVGGSRGRPAVPLSIRGGSVLALGLEVNIERIVATVVDLAGNIHAIERADVQVLELGIEEAMTKLSELSRLALAQCPAEARVVGAVLALPGLVDRSGQSVLRAPNLGWDGSRPADYWNLEIDGTPIPLRAANDVDCSALTLLRENSESSFVYITGEVGIGSSISMNGQLLTGRHGWASELGHICVDPRGNRCGCGAIGCLESVVGAHALLQASGKPDMAELLAAIEAGDEQHQKLIDRAGEALGIAISAALNLLDVSTVNLGGHLGPLEPYLHDSLKRELAQRVLWARHSEIELAVIEQAPLRAATGAGIAAFSSVISDPATWINPLVER